MSSQSSPLRPHVDRLPLIKREGSDPLPEPQSKTVPVVRPLLTGPNSLQLRLPVINVVPPTPLPIIDPYATLFSPSSNQFAHWLSREIAEEEQAVSSLLFTSRAQNPIPPFDNDNDDEVAQRFAPLKHCYTDQNYHLWQEDYTNWCIRAQNYFDTHDPRANLTLPAQRAFAGNQRGPLERYMLEVDAFPLHPASEPFSMKICNGLIGGNYGSSKRDFVCFRCGKVRYGDKAEHATECAHSLPFEQTVYYFAWESLRRGDKEALLMRIPRVWQDAPEPPSELDAGNGLDRDRGSVRERELARINEEQAELNRELSNKVDKQSKRLEEVDGELQKVKAEMKHLRSKFRSIKLGGSGTASGLMGDVEAGKGKENKECSLQSRLGERRSPQELLGGERSRVKRTRLR